ncbi:MAG: hypothetical protein WCC25_01520 [Candidatus Korobacteraceae bacterium]
MKVFGVISTIVMFLLLGSIVPAFAQEASHEQEAKPAAQEEKQAKPAAQQEKQAKPVAQQEKQAKPVAQQEKQAKPVAQQEKQAKPVAQQEKQAKPVARTPQTKPVNQGGPSKAAAQKPPQRSAADEQRQRAVPALRLSATGSGRIPDDRFRSNFGGGHTFVIDQPVMVGGYSRFQYGGYWFGFVQPWPVGWYYTDHVYVDYIGGGYYLFNPFYPGVRVEISVVL